VLYLKHAFEIFYFVETRFILNLSNNILKNLPHDVFLTSVENLLLLLLLLLFFKYTRGSIDPQG